MANEDLMHRLNILKNCNVCLSDFLVNKPNNINFSNIWDIIQISNNSIYNFSKKINGKIVHISNGSTGMVYKIIWNNNSVYCCKFMTLSEHELYNSYNDSQRPENVEILIMYLLRDLSIKKKFKHIILPICIFYTNFDEYKMMLDITVNKNIWHINSNLFDENKNKKIEKANKKIIEYLEKIDKKNISNIVVSVFEYANYGSLLDYFRNNHTSLSL